MSAEDRLDSAPQWHSDIVNSAPPSEEHRQVIVHKSCEEQAAGFLSQWFTREEMDSRWGRAKWRALRRFCIWQDGAGKWRLMDDAKASGHNSAATAWERIHTTCREAGIFLLALLAAEGGTPEGGTEHSRHATCLPPGTCP